jgi:hypothetical protein
MPRKKTQSLSQLTALKGVRKPLPPPSRVKEDEKKYRRSLQRRTVQKEVEQDAGEE